DGNVGNHRRRDTGRKTETGFSTHKLFQELVSIGSEECRAEGIGGGIQGGASAGECKSRADESLFRFDDSRIALLIDTKVSHIMTNLNAEQVGLDRGPLHTGCQ